MGTVYLAEHTLLGRQAAIKVLLPELCNRAELVTRFFNEARAASTVQHPGIVEIFDFGHHRDGSAFIVMELLQGESLAARLRRVRVLPEALAASYVRQMCSGLAAAHAKGIIHRDIKPDNVFLVPDPIAIHGERIKILDFGIAKLAAEQLIGSMRTRTGTVLGTPMYMSPEQCRGIGEVDHRSDLYSLGCILYAMVCGRPPFVSEGMGDVMARHIYEPVVPPSSLAPTSPAFESIVMRALAKNPAARYGSADELAAALEQIFPTGSYAAPPLFPATPVPGIPTPGGMYGIPTPGAMHGLPTPGAMHGTPMPTTPMPTTPMPGTPMPVLTPPTPAHWPAATTTPSTPGALGRTPSSRAERSGRGRWVIAAAVVGAVALAVVLILPGRESPPAADRPAAAPAEPAATPAEPAATPAEPAATPAEPAATPAEPAAAPAEPAAPAPASIALRITSSPSEAEVYRMPGRERVGTTPLQLSLPAAAGQVSFLVERRGHRSETITFPADRDGSQDVHLRTRAPRDDKREANPPGPGNTLNPFER